MKVLFLDVDGVLNSAEWFAKQQPTKDCCTVDPKAVARVLRVLTATDARLVLSSTWRLVPELVQQLRDVGLPIYDVTPRLQSAHRGEEICIWLRTHSPIDAFAIIDDDPDAGVSVEITPAFYLFPRFVRTHWKHGMYGRHEQALIALLGLK